MANTQTVTQIVANTQTISDYDQVPPGRGHELRKAILNRMSRAENLTRRTTVTMSEARELRAEAENWDVITMTLLQRNFPGASVAQDFLATVPSVRPPETPLHPRLEGKRIAEAMHQRIDYLSKLRDGVAL